MPLPDVIEITPLSGPIRAEISVPGSKSITNRALILAALADGMTELNGALWSEDTQVMVNALKTLGFQITVSPDPNEFCNRTIRVKGMDGEIPLAGTEKIPLEVFVGNAGTAARFLAPLVCLGRGRYRLHGVPRMHERPQAALFEALRKLGYQIDSPNNKLPALIRGTGPQPGLCEVSVRESSQFASGLILCSRKGGWRISMASEFSETPPYVHMTSELIESFPDKGGSFPVEPDASSGSYFLAADRLVPSAQRRPGEAPSSVVVAHWPTSRWQIDQCFPEVIRRTAALHHGLEAHQNGTIREGLKNKGSALSEGSSISREKDLGDSIMTAIVIAPLALEKVRFTDLGRLRVQETERVAALKTELAKCGANVKEAQDMLEVFPSELHGAEIETYDDHRIAMCFAILGLKVPGIRIKNPACVKKTFPNFFQKLASPSPRGLGTRIVDVASGEVLPVARLFAD
jgi:3-phosphoshikimate 1-carboxyvinyltransferase